MFDKIIDGFVKTFIAEDRYKMFIKGSYRYLCSWSCYRKAEREKENKKKTKEE